MGGLQLLCRAIAGLICWGMVPVFALAAEALDSERSARGEAQYNLLCQACHNGSLLEAPRLEALRLYDPQRIVEALEFGVMATQGLPLSRSAKHDVAYFLTGREYSDAQITLDSFSCSAGTQVPVSYSAGPVWNGWGSEHGNTRHQPGAADLTPANVADLELKWAFAVPGATRSRAQPLVTPEFVFIGSQQGVVYALDSDNGCPAWLFQAQAEVRGALYLETDASGLPSVLYFGDFSANAYAIDARTGELLWTTKVHDHPNATVTGSVIAHDNILIVPVSSSEIIAASRNEYSCCTFRGAVVALNTSDGSELWRYYTTDEPRPTITNRDGVQQYGPSGAPVWAGPTIDTRRRLVYAVTGENYSSPATATSDAAIALDLDNGTVQWITQVTANDAWNGACSTGGINCPEEDGPDYDFGASAMIARTRSNRELIILGQKSGMVYALDPDNGGEMVWRQRVGSGGTMGGVHYGLSTDGTRVYVGMSDLPTNNPYNVGDPHPGLHALNIDSGDILWRNDLPNRCESDGFLCWPGISAAVSSNAELVFAGGLDGILRAFDAVSGAILWETNTRQSFGERHGIEARGGSIEADGPVVANGRVYVTSGYEKWGEAPGNVLLVYGLPD